MIRWVWVLGLVLLGVSGGVAVGVGIESGNAAAPTTTAAPTAQATTSTTAMDMGEADRPTIIQFQGAEREQLAQQLATVREVAMRYPTRADAAAAGFEPTTPFTPGLGSHMGRDDWTQTAGQPLDLQKPQSYLYDGTEPTSRLVGVMYVVIGGDTAPDGFAGPLDTWHEVKGSCLKADEFDPLYPAADGVTKQMCDAGGGRFLPTNVWTQHVWVVPGWEAPGGVFARSNTDIVCADGTTKSDPVTGCTSPVRP
ncbi:MAG: hypothetical protein U0Q22_11260 [Acidimicrobiales bacterium]